MNGSPRSGVSIQARRFRAVRVIARIEDPAVIKKILTHLVRKRHSAEATPLPHSRAPPGAGLFD